MQLQSPIGILFCTSVRCAFKSGEETLDDSRVNFGEDKVNFKEASEEDSDETREARKIDGEVTPYSGEVTGDEQDVEPKQAEEIQGRFFLKDKLCALGLTDVRI